MRNTIFLWSDRNEEHIAQHGVAPEEAEYVVEYAEMPYPQKTGDERWIVWGKTRRGRFLQVAFVDVELEDVRFDEFERLEFYERVALNAGDRAIRVIHSRDLTDAEKRQLRRRKRGQT